jgi:membrane protein
MTGSMGGRAPNPQEPRASVIPECTNVADLKRRAADSHDNRTAGQALRHSARWLWRDPKAFIAILRYAMEGWSKHNISRLSAALAYYAVFSLAPVLIISISIAGLAFGKDVAQHAIGQEIQSLIGQDSGKAVLAMIQSARKPAATSLVAIFGLGTLLFSASGAFVEIQDALNTIWEIEPRPRGTIWYFLRKRFVSFGMVLSIGFLLLVSLVVSAALTALGRWGSALAVPTPIFHLVDALISFVVITAIFALLYKIVPDARTAWTDVWPAAATTALLFTIGKFLIGFYVTKSLTASAYGAASSAVIVLAWVYYSAQILYSGAEIARACDDYRTTGQRSSAQEQTAGSRSEYDSSGPRRAHHATP